MPHSLPHSKRSFYVVGLLILFLLTGLLAADKLSLASAPSLHLQSLPATGDGLLRVELRVQGGVDVAGWEADLHYDATRLALISMESADAFGRVDSCDDSGPCVLLLGPQAVLGGSSIGGLAWGGPGLTGDGPLATLTFRPLTGEGSVALSLASPIVTNSQGQAVTPLGEDITIDLGHTTGHSIFLPAVTNE